MIMPNELEEDTTMESTPLLKSLKENLIRVAKHHKEYCIGAECNISLYQLLQVAVLAELKFSDKEKSLFL